MNLIRLLYLGLTLSAIISSAYGWAPGSAATSWLRASGRRVVDERGRTVVLAGVNLGGWLVEEMWMMPFQTKPPAGAPEIADHVTLWRAVERRFGKAGKARLRTALRNAWITEFDFARIRQAGMNCVRLPFTYDLLEEPDGWSWINKTLRWARKHGLYVILDLHGAPGRQSAEHHTGESGIDRLFKNPALVERTAALWAKIARRYRDHPEVAAYDLLNEPMGAPDSSTLYLVQDRLYRAIRAVDTRHIIIVEDGYKGIDTFPRPQLSGWKNVILSFHHYHFNAKSAADQRQAVLKAAFDAGRIAESRQAPVLIGEFQLEPHGTPDALEAGLRAFQEGGHHWTIWTHKVALKDGSGGMWGCYRAPKPPRLIDVFRDSESDLRAAFGRLRSERIPENAALTRAFRAASAVRPLPPLQEVVPTARRAAPRWQYTLRKPAEGWSAQSFDASRWKTGPGGFGGVWPFEGKARTPWTTSAIWLRREFTIPESGYSNLRLIVCHDDDAEIYLNGILAATLPGYTHRYEEVMISPEALSTLKPGRNLLAVHGSQGAGEQYIDAGLLGLPGGK